MMCMNLLRKKILTNFDLEKSKVKWTGKKITNASHWGHINFTKADMSWIKDYQYVTIPEYLQL